MSKVLSRKTKHSNRVNQHFYRHFFYKRSISSSADLLYGNFVVLEKTSWAYCSSWDIRSDVWYLAKYTAECGILNLILNFDYIDERYKIFLTFLSFFLVFFPFPNMFQKIYYCWLNKFTVWDESWRPRGVSAWSAVWSTPTRKSKFNSCCYCCS